MLLGDLKVSNLVNILKLFLGIVAIAFSTIGISNYAIICIMLGGVLQYFNINLLKQEEHTDAELAFELELENLQKFVTFSVAPAILLIQVSTANSFAVFISALFMLSGAIQLAHYNRPFEFQQVEEETVQYGIPTLYIAAVLPVLSLLGWFLPGIATLVIWLIFFSAMTAVTILKVPIAELNPKYRIWVLAAMVLLMVLVLIQGPLSF